MSQVVSGQDLILWLTSFLESDWSGYTRAVLAVQKIVHLFDNEEWKSLICVQLANVAGLSAGSICVSVQW